MRGKKDEVSITGAVEELFSLNNQIQADRLFTAFKSVDQLCTTLLALSAVNGDISSAALVVEQMAFQGYFLRDREVQNEEKGVFMNM
jgi:hypothetical protein